MHFVARDWNLDLAIFLRFHRADLDTPDNFGRTPLFVAVAMNYKAMVEWLLDHKGKEYRFLSFALFWNAFYILRTLFSYFSMYLSLNLQSILKVTHFIGAFDINEFASAVRCPILVASPVNGMMC